MWKSTGISFLMAILGMIETVLFLRWIFQCTENGSGRGGVVLVVGLPNERKYWYTIQLTGPVYYFPYFFLYIIFLNMPICSLRCQVHDVKSGRIVLCTKMCCVCTIKELTSCCCHTGAGAVASREEVERGVLGMSQVAGKKVHFIIAKFWCVLLSQKM